MVFKEAYEALKQGAMIKLPEWAGYWKWEDNSIKMHCKDGKILDIRETEDVDYTLKFIMRDEWEIVGEADVKDLNIQTFTFGEAIRNLKAGKRVARKGWNGKEMFIYLSTGYSINVDDVLNRNLCEYLAKTSNDGIVCINSHIDMKAADGSLVIGWLASQTDMLAEDWVIVEQDLRCIYA